MGVREHFCNTAIEILRFFEIGIPVRMITLMGNTKAVDIPEDVPEVEGLMRAAE